MRAIILNAGLGKRMRPLTDKTHKCLLDVNGKTILQHQLDVLEACGTNEVIVVTGAKADMVDDYVVSLDTSMDVKTVFNPFYAITENIVSLWFVKDYLEGDVVVMMGDLIFEEDIIRNLINGPSRCNLVVHEKDNYDKDDMKVKIKGDKIKSISKLIEIPDCEYMQISHYNAAGVAELKATIDTIIKDQRFYGWYPEAIQDLIDKGMDVSPIYCNGFKWKEIDSPEDLENAKGLA